MHINFSGRMKFQRLNIIDGNIEVCLLMGCGICIEESESNQRGESKILTVFSSPELKVQGELL